MITTVIYNSKFSVNWVKISSVQSDPIEPSQLYISRALESLFLDMNTIIINQTIAKTRMIEIAFDARVMPYTYITILAAANAQALSSTEDQCNV